MPGQTLYSKYKEKTSTIVCWLITESNKIIRSNKTAAQNEGVKTNTTGRCTVAEIVNMSKLIGKHLKPIPDPMLAVFDDVIKARMAVFEAFKNIANENPDPSIQESNKTHKHFIDALKEAYNALDSRRSTDIRQVTDERKEEWLCNIFSDLDLEGAEEDVSEDEDPSATSIAQKATGKTKMTSRTKKSKKPSRDAYGIIEDTNGDVTQSIEYFFAVFAVITEWVHLRSYAQDVWHDVAYEELKGAVAAPLVNCAVAMVKQTCLAMFADYPDHESYDAIIQTITRGNPELQVDIFSLLGSDPPTSQLEELKNVKFDLKEDLWIHAYNDLVEFITNFRQNRNGKPTKAMSIQLWKWSPEFDLQKATDGERIKWRRLYTINWLFDLVNVYSSVVISSDVEKGEKNVYEDVNWSKSGPWYHHRRLFGLDEFAGDITSLVMHKETPDLKKKIMPHHVFQLQTIVDSYTTSRGWTVHPGMGHKILRAPKNFSPRREIDLFLEREHEADKFGPQREDEKDGLDPRCVRKSLKSLNAYLNSDLTRHPHSHFLEELKLNFENSLGKSKYKSTHSPAGPPSRFNNHNANGLWDYSPMLCANGLTEGIILVQRVILDLWDNTYEPTLLIHLHNMLGKKGYLEKPHSVIQLLQFIFQDCFFPNGVPKDTFPNALSAQIRRIQHKSNRLRHQPSDKATDFHSLFHNSHNKFLNAKPMIMSFWDAHWISDHIPDSEIIMSSMLQWTRIKDLAHEKDPLTGNLRLEQTEMVKRAKRYGLTDAQLLSRAESSDFEAVAAQHAASQSDMTRNPYQVSEHKARELFQGRGSLDLIRPDLFQDVCGVLPGSGFNYPGLTLAILKLFDAFEKKFEEKNHPLWKKLYANLSSNMKHPSRVELVLAAMRSEDDEALEIFAEVFEEQWGYIHVLHFIYWDELEESDRGFEKSAKAGQVSTDSDSWESESE